MSATKGWCIFLLLVSLACDKEQDRVAPSAESGSDKEQAAAIDPELAQAVAAASAAQPPTAPPSDAQGPPPRGVFAPGAADAEIAVGAPPQITLGGTGSEPRLRLRGGFGSKATPTKRRIQVVLQGAPGQRGLPVDLELAFEGSAASPSSEGSTPPRQEIRGKVLNAAFPGGAGRLPPPLAEGLQRLRGSEVHFELWPDGGATGFRTVIKEGTPPELGDVMRALGDAIATATLPFPDEEVGAGGYWMATSRDGLMGLDLVTYRLIRVESVTDGVATLHVGTKRYAAGTDFSLAGLEGQFLLEEFQAGGEGSLRYQPGVSLPLRGQLQLTLGALLLPQGATAVAGQQGQRGRLEFVSQASFGEP